MTDIEAEVDAIRDKIYEKIKDMTPAEEVAYFHAVAEEARTKYHFRVIDRIPEERPGAVNGPAPSAFSA